MGSARAVTEQMVSSSPTGALTWIVGSRKGGVTRDYGFSLFVFFPSFFFFPQPWLVFEGCQSRGTEPAECGGAEGKSFHTRLLCCRE